MSKPKQTLAEKHGKQIVPLTGLSELQNDCGGNGCDIETSTTTPGGSNESYNNACDCGNETGISSIGQERTNRFKMGADSIDLDKTSLEDFYGLLSPSSPPDSGATPTTPTSPSQLKSSIRDPLKPKTPPGTPSRKSVRFADALGLDLETVKTIMRNESPPDLNVHVDEERQTISAKVISLCFQQPGGQPDFIKRLNKQNVCLENVVLHEFTLIGTIKVRNLGFEKAVRIRSSSDNWTTFVDVMAMYVAGSCDGPTDRFSFGLSAPKTMVPGAIMSFAIYYRVEGETYWDNNGGENYSLVCEEVKKG